MPPRVTLTPPLIALGIEPFLATALIVTEVFASALKIEVPLRILVDDESAAFTEAETQLIGDRWVKAAGNFAVKEAVSKMFGTGFRGISLKEIEVLRDELGKPYVKLYGKAAECAKQQGITRIHVSITNTKEYANAFVIGENHIGLS